MGVHDEPLDPFAGDPSDPAFALDDEEGRVEPLSPEERQDVLDDLADLEIYEALLAQRGVRGLVVDCEDCRVPHYFAWDLLRANLRHLLEAGRTRVHEPAFDPDPTEYVTWEYARGYADGAQDAAEDEPDEDGFSDADETDADEDAPGRTT
ncbi:MAG: hypothetical protein QOI35_860 [Cryptosporangiaceae bacterium]|nr:hypothetical protein [Frankiales bacterium]MDQ1651660.1 hypothetical protein [Cryptosporangiaceae bacterium]MDQ1657030.1 hypothetical protein [Cryptosporangiaceae bacterium]